MTPAGQGTGGRPDRAEFRAFVLANHPDRGGDPEAFVAGMARLRATAVPAEAGTAHPRDDAPVEVVTPLPVPVRVAVALLRTWRRRHVRRVL